MTAPGTDAMRPIRMGLIGFGAHMAENLYPVLAASPDFRIAAVSSRDPGRARALAERFGLGRAVQSWRDLLDPGLVDAVAVATTPAHHAEILAAALPAGIHVFVEKPPAPGRRALDALIALEAEHERTVAFVDFNFRYSALLAEVRRQSAGLAHPRLLKIRMLASKPLAPLWDGGSVEESFLYAVGIHAIDLATWLLGEPTLLAATHTPLGPSRFALALTLSFPDGARAVLDLGNYSNRFESEFELVASDGAAARISDLREVVFHQPPAGDSRFSSKEVVHFSLPGLRGGFAHGGYEGALAAFHAAIHHAEAGSGNGRQLRRAAPVYRIIEEALAACTPDPSPAS
jgi:predicted dehydrogenase